MALSFDKNAIYTLVLLLLFTETIPRENRKIKEIKEIYLEFFNI